MCISTNSTKRVLADRKPALRVFKVFTRVSGNLDHLISVSTEELDDVEEDDIEAAWYIPLIPFEKINVKRCIVSLQLDQILLKRLLRPLRH